MGENMSENQNDNEEPTVSDEPNIIDFEESNNNESDINIDEWDEGDTDIGIKSQ